MNLKNLLKKKREQSSEEGVSGFSGVPQNFIENVNSTTTPTENTFNEYDLFLLNFYHNLKKPKPQQEENSELNLEDIKNIHLKQSSLRDKSYRNLSEKIKKFIQDSQKIKSSLAPTNKKVIGITPEEIFSARRYQVDLKNLPKFSKFFDKLTNDVEYSGSKTRIYMSNFLDSALEGKHKKKQQTLSFVERQNSEALRSIEEKRQKFKHLPKSNKEKMDNNNLHKHWNWIAKKEIPKMFKVYQKFKNDNDYNCKRFSTLAQKEVKKKVSKVQRLQKETNMRGKRLQKEMLVFWRKRDKEIMEIKKKKDKYEVEKKKKEDELQEMVIQKKRLEYLMKQSDIYSFFMIRNMGMITEGGNQDENKEEDENSIQETPIQNLHEKFQNAQSTVIGDNEVLINPKTNKVIFQSIKVDIDENAAKEGVKQLIQKQRDKMMKFDQQTNKIRETLGGEAVKTKKFDDINIDQEDNQVERLDKPMISQASLVVEAPRSFMGELKEYQLKGLRWLDNLYDQGINGILADEMGLGKTIQAISFLAHLTEEKNNWGPFLVVSPNATLYNWQQELNKFCPSLKVLPYWGGLKERKTLRKFFVSQNLYTKQAAFHVCVTSYQLVVSDEKVFNRVNWQYMILDEAQAIKNINSQRWNTLLSFNCRNRLLLSGTPIQNSMSELWALLHFIMPNLFDSHEQFQEWFSKDIEAHSQEKGELNQEQLNRLHKILKPFMLRRVKKDVENEIGPKFEYEILCNMTERQKILYNSIKEKLSNISDLFSSVDSKVKVENLMNLVMQFRKVCNHPEIFERNFGKVPFIFRDLNFSRTSTFVSLPNSIAELRTDWSTGNCISYNMPKLIFDEAYGEDFILKKFSKYSVFNYNNIIEGKNKKFNSLFSFVGLFKFSTFEFLNLLKTDTLITQISLYHYLNEISSKNNFFNNQKIFSEILEVLPHSPLNIFINKQLYPIKEDIMYRSLNLGNHYTRPLIYSSILEMKEDLYKPFTKHRFHIPRALSLPIQLQVSSSRPKIESDFLLNNLTIDKLLYGSTFKQYNSKEIRSLHQSLVFNGINANPYVEEKLKDGLMTPLFYKNEGYSQVELPSFERLVADCAKLKKLDELLIRLKRENHRVLIFCQMTRMIDILEEYMAKRRYTYFRMDGSTNIADRRDMVNEYQVNTKIFAFLLSTRAGGLGVNLTGADTVIFYDNDWNPTMDAQATDRAHRIGQTKVVSVYRLITKNTIEERILKRAKQKQNVQTTVYAGGAFKADIFKQSEIVELLYSEEEVKKLEYERKRLQELNSNMAGLINMEKKEGDGMMIDSVLPVSDVVNVSSAKKKGKKGKKETGPKEKGKKGKSSKAEINSDVQMADSQIASNPYAKPTITSARNIFAVSSNQSSKPKVNTLKADS
jgi:chromatin-remodeling ATPase INO80